MNEGVKPIKPEEIVDKKFETIPAAIIQATNELIAKKWNGHSSVIKKEELLERYFELSGMRNDRDNRDKLYANHSLDIEDVYRREGWKVEYDAPGFRDSDYEPYFTFTIDKKKDN
jgi:hypothetical protein